MRSLASALRLDRIRPLDAALTMAAVLLLAVSIPDFLRWSLIDAVWSGTSGRDCAGGHAACWIFIGSRFEQILFGGYPPGERWRLFLVVAVALVGIAGFLAPSARRRPLVGLAQLLICALVAAALLRGGAFGLAPVPTDRWGGLMLTMVVAAWTIATAFPLGLLLAFGRRSRLPVVAAVSASYIDVMRGLPLVGVLFLAIIMFPLFIPPGIEIDKLLRALIAFTLFNAAIFAEVLRGGLQSVPATQAEAGSALGLRRWQTTLLIVVPQALRTSLPATINVCIAIIKETTIILIVGLFDLLGVLQGGTVDPEWLVGDAVPATAYFFAGIVFWTICFGLSRYSVRLERAMKVGH